MSVSTSNPVVVDRLHCHFVAWYLCSLFQMEDEHNTLSLFVNGSNIEDGLSCIVVGLLVEPSSKNRRTQSEWRAKVPLHIFHTCYFSLDLMTHDKLGPPHGNSEACTQALLKE